MELDEIFSHLRFFGLDETDSKIYTGLLQLGPISVGTLAVKLEIDRGKAYRALGKLKNFGIVSTTFSNPTICTAVKPRNALTTIIQRKEDEIITMKNLAKKVDAILDKINRVSELPSGIYLSIIQGRTNIFSRIGRMIQQTKKTLYILSTIEDLSMMYHTSIPEKIEIAKKNNFEIRIITSINNDNDINVINRLCASEIRVGKLPSKSRIIVEENKELIMSGRLSDMMNLKDENDSVLCTNSKEMVNNMFNLCSLLWKKSKRIELILAKRK